MTASFSRPQARTHSRPRSRVLATEVFAFSATDTHVYVARRDTITRFTFANPGAVETVALLPEVDEETVIAANHTTPPQTQTWRSVPS